MRGLAGRFSDWLRSAAGYVLKWFVGPLAILVILIGASGIGLWIWSLTSSRAANAGDYQAGLAGFTKQQRVTKWGPEAWRAHYNIGTTYLQQKHLDAGVGELQTSFKLLTGTTKLKSSDQLDPDSPECMVRVNLSVGMERQADALNQSGKGDQAKGLWKQAETASKPCADSKQSSDQAKTADESHKRQHQKSDPDQAKRGDSKNQNQQQKDQRSKQPDAKPSPNPSSSEDPAEAERQRKLQQRNQEHSEEQDSQGGGRRPDRYW